MFKVPLTGLCRNLRNLLSHGSFRLICWRWREGRSTSEDLKEVMKLLPVRESLHSARVARIQGAGNKGSLDRRTYRAGMLGLGLAGVSGILRDSATALTRVLQV